jgi:UDP-glucose 4-epimerase
MYKKRRSCCVIGGAGFIGSHLTYLLAASGRDVTVIGRGAVERGKLPPGIQYSRGDYSDRRYLAQILRGTDEVIDLAYATAPQTSFADPMFDLLANVPPSVGLLHEAVTARVRRVLLVSSGGTVYAVAHALPIGEDHPTAPISPYGITKLTIENYGRMFQTLFDLPVVVVRPANAYGEGQRSISGQGFIAAAIHRIAQGKEVDIYGSNGTVRDYIHVSDVATGIVAALNNGVPGHAYNIGTGRGRSNTEVLRFLEQLAVIHGLSVRINYLPERRFDVAMNYLDSSRLQAISEWRPQVAFEDGVTRLWQNVIASQGR